MSFYVIINQFLKCGNITNIYAQFKYKLITSYSKTENRRRYISIKMNVQMSLGEFQNAIRAMKY